MQLYLDLIQMAAARSQACLHSCHKLVSQLCGLARLAEAIDYSLMVRYQAFGMPDLLLCQFEIFMGIKHSRPRFPKTKSTTGSSVICSAVDPAVLSHRCQTNVVKRGIVIQFNRMVP
ncbi:MAG: hypothetical protein JWM58_2906 [Rhizobium sp.]|nr:hypothetical protein [Rhizobium sp.]